MIDRKTKTELDEVAKLSSLSMSEVVRELLKKGLPKRKRASIKAKKGGGISFLKQQAGKAVRGPGNSQYDKYIYDLDYEPKSK